MPQNRSGYTLRFEKFGSGDDSLGCAALIPWDSDIFDFPVAQYRIGSDRIAESQTGALSECLLSWLHRNDVALCSCTVPAGNAFWKSYLPSLGFDWVDLVLRVALNGLHKTSLRPARFTLRRADPGDSDAISAIAGQAFDHGRYHADPRFSGELADRRYRQWAINALAGSHPDEHLYVMGEPGNVQGFYHVALDESVADLRLAAVAPELQGTMLGFDLYLAVLDTLKELGVRRVVSTVSGTNTSVINVYSMLGFRFSEPEIIYHWHVPRSQAEVA
jgi:ribosomal protein S18 acetylase RimI-like enzyme